MFYKVYNLNVNNILKAFAKTSMGEGFDYDEIPDYRLTEMSGIPYGVMNVQKKGKLRDNVD